MLEFTKIEEIKDMLRAAEAQGKSIGFVPTMGYLHDGHKSLISRAKAENDLAVVSIFVNPIQFGPSEDFEKYPRDIEHDRKAAKEAGADIIFRPSAEEMYPENFSTCCTVKNLSERLCGKSRPGHFDGVTTVVLKLFNIIRPTRAYFGQKDAQQLVIIKRMAKDLNLDVEIVGCPTVREKDGLAMSSRNVYLSDEERKQAPCLNRALSMAKKAYEGGEKDAGKIKELIKSEISAQKLAVIDYIACVDAETLEDVKTMKPPVLIALAVKFGRARLIDNILIE